jgi:hypothetical protein
MTLSVVRRRRKGEFMTRLLLDMKAFSELELSILRQRSREALR